MIFKLLIYYANPGDPLLPVQKVTYDYVGTNMTELKVFQYDMGVLQTIPSDVSTFVYNANNNVIQSSYFDGFSNVSNYYNYFAPNFVSYISKDNTPTKTFAQYVYSSSLSLEKEAAANSISCYPNPGTNELNIDLGTIESILIQDDLGRTVISQTSNSKRVSTQELHPGIYAVSIKTKTGMFQSKWIKN
jgi:hypothetical protein